MILCGIAFTEWGKKFLKMDSKVVKKIAGTLLGATSGTGGDVVTLDRGAGNRFAPDLPGEPGPVTVSYDEKPWVSL